MYCKLETYSTSFSGASDVDFEEVNIYCFLRVQKYGECCADCVQKVDKTDTRTLPMMTFRRNI